MRVITSISCVLLILGAATASAQMRAVNTQPVKIAPRTLVGNVADALFGLGTAAGGQLTPQQFRLVRDSFLAGGGGGYGGGGGLAATAVESYDRGTADLIRASGDYNLKSSEALINLNEAWRRSLENDKAMVDAYFSIREANREWRALEHGPRATAQDLARYAKQGVPRRLSPSELDSLTGQVSWPMLLRGKTFDAQRDVVDQAFTRRAANGTLGAEDFLVLRRVLGAMLDQLRFEIRDLPPAQYLAARQFLESLSLEAGRSTAVTGLSPALARLR